MISTLHASTSDNFTASHQLTSVAQWPTRLTIPDDGRLSLRGDTYTFEHFLAVPELLELFQAFTNALVNRHGVG